jgi:VWFA-related protein
MSLSIRSSALLTFLLLTCASVLPQSDSSAPAQSALGAQAATQTPAQTSSQTASQTTSEPTITFRTTVRRVIVDVVVRDSNSQPVHGLTAKDFVVAEDGRPQAILSFDVHNLESPSISLPANTHLPANHFVNIPAAPERGPLYVILYDLVNMDTDNQIDARRQVLKFIKSKPAGTRFAIFVRSDGLYLVQGFTDDKAVLYSVLDPQNPKAHVPRVFLMGMNYGHGDPVSMMNVLTQVTEFMDGIPGHKNLIWLADRFPLALAPRKEDPTEYEDIIHAEINVLTRANVAIYPINVGGVPVNPAGSLTGSRANGGNNNQTATTGGQIQGTGAGANSLSTPDATGMIASIESASVSDSAYTDYDVQKTIAQSTGGQAFYNTNDVTAALDDATDIGGNYYALSYSPTNAKDDGGRRSIAVRVDHPGYKLSYRRYYFTGAYRPAEPAKAQSSEGSGATPEQAANDTLQSNMKHGAPMIHELLFSAHIRTEGKPAKATAEQMAELADQPAYFTTHHKDKPVKALASMELQKYVIDYRVTDLALKAQVAQNSKPPAFEFAAAAFDADSRMLNGIVNDATGDASNKEQTKSGVFRVEQEIEVPTKAAWIRVGVRDKLSNRVGTLEVALPLAPEPPGPSTASAR